MVARIRTPASGPAWLPPYNTNIERAIEQAIESASLGTVSDETGAFTVTATVGRKIFLINVSGLSVALPSASGNGAELIFKLMVPGSFTLTSTDGIDGESTLKLTMEYEAVTLFSSGSEWVVLMAYQPLADVAEGIEGIEEASEYLEACGRASVHLLSQLVALSRGKNDPPPSDEGDVLIKAFMEKEDL